MKRYFYSFLSFILSISIIIVCALFSSIPTYAKSYYTWEEVQKDVTTSINYIVSQCKAVANGDFSNYVQGLDAWENYWNEDNVTINDQNISYSSDLVDFIKQALREYSEETNGLYLAPTINVHDIPVEFFSSSNRYHSLVDIVDSLGLVGVARNCSYLVDLTVVHNNSCSFVAGITSETDFDLLSSKLSTRVYNNETWAVVSLGGTDQESFAYDSVRHFPDIATERCQWNDGVYPVTNLTAPYRVPRYFVFCYTNGENLSSLGSYNPSSWSNYNANYAVWSSDGRRVRVWKNETAFIYGTENQRTVYFGRDFYNSTPSQVTVSADDLNNSIEKLDTVLDKLLDKIDGNTEESEIEDILQQILDEIKGSGGGSGGNQGGSSGGSYDDTGLLNTLSGYFSSVLAYLESILQAVEALVWIEADDTVNADKKDLFDLIDRIWQDPENGSQEAADTISGSFADVARGITKKFPFSIPWDIHALFTVFANAGSPEPAAMAYSAVHYSDSGGIQAYTTDPEDLAQDAHDAPYFVLPLVIESYGINENLVIDLKDFQTLSTLSRSLFAVLFAVFLIKFTVSLMEMFKGGADG